MLGLVLLSLLGIAGTAFMFDEIFNDDDNDDDAAPQDEAEIEDETDETDEDEDRISISDAILTGTEGDDVIDRDMADALPSEVDTFDMLGGDDVVDHGPAAGVTINGGDGDDTLSILNEENELNGGAGDDRLSAELGSTVTGGEGDDVILFDQGDGVLDGRGEIDGGAGDDSITVTTDIGFIVSDNGPVHVTGGDGADTFEIAIDQVPEDEFYDPRGEGADPTLVTIEDFNPDEDALVVDVTPIEESTGRDLVDTQLTEQGNGDYELALTFSGSAGALGPLSTTMTLRGTGGITLEDIAIVQN